MKKTVYEMFVDTWRMAARYQFRKLSESEWESFISEGRKLQEKYERHGSQAALLYRDLFGAVQSFYQKYGSCTGATAKMCECETDSPMGKDEELYESKDTDVE